MIIAALIIVTLFALVALVVGFRGRRIDDHSICRRCGFDLHGKPSDSTVCAECGADLSRLGAVRIGHRVRRNAWLTVGIFLMVIDVGATGIFVASRTTNFNWLHYEYIGWVVRQASSARSEIRGPALDELLSRSSAGLITPSQWPAVIDAAVAYESNNTKPWDTKWSSLLSVARGSGHFRDERWEPYLSTLIAQCKSVDTSRRDPALRELIADLNDGKPTPQQWNRPTAAALDCQADQDRSWSTSWGDIVESARDKQCLTNADWQRYAAQAWPGMFTLRVRSNVRRGDPVPYWIDCNQPRAAKPSKLGCRVLDPIMNFDSLPPTKPNGSHSSMGGGLDGGGGLGQSLQPDDFPANAVDGVQHVHVTGTVHIDLRDRVFDDKTPPLASGQFNLSGTFVLQPASQPTVKIIHDPTLADAIRKSIKIDSVRPQLGSYSYTNANISVNGPPCGIGFDLFFAQDGHETHVSTVSCPAGTRNHSYGTGGPVRIHGPTVDIIFRSSPATAALTTDTFDVWDGTIVFHDVPVAKP